MTTALELDLRDDQDATPQAPVPSWRTLALALGWPEYRLDEIDASARPGTLVVRVTADAITFRVRRPLCLEDGGGWIDVGYQRAFREATTACHRRVTATEGWCDVPGDILEEMVVSLVADPAARRRGHVAAAPVPVLPTGPFDRCLCLGEHAPECAFSVTGDGLPPPRRRMINLARPGQRPWLVPGLWEPAGEAPAPAAGRHPAPAGPASPALPAAPLELIVADLETTGRGVRTDRIVEIAAVRVRFTSDGTPTVLAEFTRLVDPGIPIPWQATKVHGIRDVDVRGAPPVASVLPEFFAFAGSTPLLFHNAAFDRTFLERARLASELGSAGLRVYCSLRLARVALPEQPSHALTALVAALGITPRTAHRALTDVLMTVDLVAACLSRHPGRTLDALHGATEGL